MEETRARKIGILEMVESDHDKLKEAWGKLSPDSRKYFRLVDEGKLVPNLLCDSIFKAVFNPEIFPERLARLVGAILGREVKVVRSMDKEGILQSVNSKGVVLDIVVEFADGSVADVEIQRRGSRMPPQRSAVNSANLLTRRYSVEKGKRKSEMDFTMLRPVYMIVIFEESVAPFDRSPECVHHFRQSSDTGVEKGTEFELLQYYDYVCLDVFRARHPHVASMLEVWLEFLTIRLTDEMENFLADHMEFREVYDQAVRMLAGKEELFQMFQDYLFEEDARKTTLFTIRHEKEMELAKKDEEIREKDEEITAAKEQIREQRIQLREKDDYIRKLEEENRKLKNM